MSMFACPECDQQVSSSATKCPHCGKPFVSQARFALFAIGIPLLLALLGWWYTFGNAQVVDATLSDIHNKVAADAVEQYRIAEKQGDRMQTCVLAGLVAAAFLQAEDSINYDQWKATEEADCKTAGITSIGR